MRVLHLILLFFPAILLAVDPAPLRWERQEIVLLRVAFADHAPAERARRAVDRIEKLLVPDRPLLVGTQELPDGTLITIDGQGVLVLTDGDADRLIGESRATIAATTAERLRSAIADRQRLMGDQGFLGTALTALGAGIAWLIACWALWRARGHAMRRLAPGQIAVTPTSGTMAIRWIRGSLLRTVSMWGINLLALVAFLTLTSVCSTIGLSSLPSTHRWASELVQTLSAMLWDLFVALCGALPGLLMAVFIFLMAAAVNVMCARFFQIVKSGHIQLGWIDVHTVRPTRLLSSILVWGAALVMAYPYLPGSSSDAFKGVTVLLGLMVSLGASSQVGQLASGFILIYLRSIRPGDYVRVANCEGTVKDIGLFTLTLITPFSETVSLPNVLVLGSQVTNYSRPNGAATAQLQASVTIGYDTAWRTIHELLLAAANNTPGLAAHPPPVVMQRALSDFYVEYTLCVPVLDPTARVPVLSLLHANILDRFSAAGVQIMSPHYLGDPAKPKLPPAQPGDAQAARPG